MRSEDVLGALAITTSLVIAIATMAVAYVQRRQDRRDAREDKLEEWRLGLVASLVPLLDLLSEPVPGPDATNDEITEHLSLLRSDDAKQALRSVTLIGLVFPSIEVQFQSGSAGAWVTNAIRFEEAALAERDAEQRRQYLDVVGVAFEKGREDIRELARKIRGPLPWEKVSLKA